MTDAGGDAGAPDGREEPIVPPVELVGVPTDHGAERRGVDMGPSALRYAGLEDAIAPLVGDVFDAGDIDVPVTGPAASAEEAMDAVDAVRAVATTLERSVARSIASGHLPVALGGDHSLSIGSIAGSVSAGPRPADPRTPASGPGEGEDADVGVVWFDAHGDFNTPETTPSGNVHGMSLAAAAGYGSFADSDWCPAGIDPANVAVVGVRDLDDGERDNLRASAVDVYPMSAIDRRDLTAVVEDALATAGAADDGVHVSLDLDWLDPHEAPGVGTPVAGGASYREAHLAMELLAEAQAREDVRIRSVDLVEVDPILDDRNRTAELACELLASLCGKSTM